MKSLTVQIPLIESSSYDIKIKAGLLKDLPQIVEDKLGACSKMIVTDSNVKNSGHIDSLSSCGEVFVIDPPGECNKYMHTVVEILEQMEQNAMGRDSAIIAVGGGTVGDMAGFAASIFKRGIPIVHVPTTTVSQADSSIGGKTGVDSSISKNAYGAFWHPAAVFIDVETLKTLDQRQFNAGLVESIKHALISDRIYFEYLENNIDAILNRDNSTLEELALFNSKVKSSIVSIDPKEKNQRRILNYGHTIGHAIESASNFELLHGEAVAIGIIGASIIEIEIGIGNIQRLERVKKLLNKLSLPLEIPTNITKEQIYNLLSRDKKSVKGWPKFALIEDIAKVHIDTNNQWAHRVDPAVVEIAIDQLMR